MATDAEVEASVYNHLASTEYACSSITRLNGGTANFVYKGVLSNILRSSNRDESTDVSSSKENDQKMGIIIKHTKDFVALNRNFKLDAERCVYEAMALKTLESFSPVRDTSLSPPMTVKTPRLFNFYTTDHTQIMEDLPESVDLKNWLLSQEPGMRIDKPAAKAIGRSLGFWIGPFHAWTSLDQQAELRRTLTKNESMQKLKYAINYERLVNMIDNHPEILEESRSVFGQVRSHAAEEISKGSQNADGRGNSMDHRWGAIHGDFWTGNILIAGNNMFIIDWEMSQMGMRALDLGQVLAELYEIKHFKDHEAGIWIMEGLIEKYAHWDEEVAFRTAVHMGVHLVCWSNVPGWGSHSQVEDAIRIGRDLVVKGWERDRAWFERNDILRHLFRPPGHDLTIS